MLVASIATIPNRVNNGDLKKCVDGLLAQTCPLDRIFVTIPHKYRRFEPLKTLPEWLMQEPYNEKVRLIRPSEDPGPIAKYLCVAEYIADSEYKDAYVFVGDDDQIYHNTLVARMVAAIPSQDFEGVIQNRHEIVKYGSGGIIHGFVGLLVKASALRALPTFPLYDSGFMIDDQVMSIYFAHYGVPMIPSGVIQFQDIYAVLEDGHERGVRVPEALHMAGNRDHMVQQVQKDYSTTFAYGGDIKVKWKYINIPKGFVECRNLIAYAPLPILNIIKKVCPSVNFTFATADGLFVDLEEGDKVAKAVSTVSNALSLLTNGSRVYVRMNKLSLTDYDELKLLSTTQAFCKSGLKQVTCNMFELTVTHTDICTLACFVIGKNANPQKALDAGFTNVYPFQYENHAELWRRMSTLGLERIVVIEDDVSFKPEWSVYNQLLFDQTPDDFDIVYLGGEAHQDTSLLVARIPISGLYGYIITAAGARKLATLVKDHDDSAVVKKMYRALLSNERTLSWYVFGQPLITKN